MVELNEGQSCEIVACGFSAIVKIVSFVANGAIYEFNGATHVLCSPNGKEQWHWWYNADEGFAGVTRKIGVRLMNWDNSFQCVAVIADGCDSVTIL